jgi:hypothetical protein
MMPSTAANNVTLSSNPFDQVSADTRDPDVNSTVQDHARELSTLLNRMPRDILTPMIAGLQLDPAPTVHAFGLLGLDNEWASPIPTASESVQPNNPFQPFSPPSFSPNFRQPPSADFHQPPPPIFLSAPSLESASHHAASSLT